MTYKAPKHSDQNSKLSKQQAAAMSRVSAGGVALTNNRLAIQKHSKPSDAKPHKSNLQTTVGNTVPVAQLKTEDNTPDPNTFNVIGEDHDESGVSRELEKSVALNTYGIAKYFEEGVLNINLEPPATGAAYTPEMGDQFTGGVAPGGKYDTADPSEGRMIFASVLTRAPLANQIEKYETELKNLQKAGQSTSPQLQQFEQRVRSHIIATHNTSMAAVKSELLPADKKALANDIYQDAHGFLADPIWGNLAHPNGLLLAKRIVKLWDKYSPLFFNHTVFAVKDKVSKQRSQGMHKRATAFGQNASKAIWKVGQDHVDDMKAIPSQSTDGTWRLLGKDRFSILIANHGTDVILQLDDPNLLNEAYWRFQERIKGFTTQKLIDEHAPANPVTKYLNKLKTAAGYSFAAKHFNTLNSNLKSSTLFVILEHHPKTNFALQLLLMQRPTQIYNWIRQNGAIKPMDIFEPAFQNSKVKEILRKAIDDNVISVSHPLIQKIINDDPVFDP